MKIKNKDSLLASSVTRRSLTSSQGQAANNSNSANEDDYICETLRPATMAQEFRYFFLGFYW